MPDEVIDGTAAPEGGEAPVAEAQAPVDEAALIAGADEMVYPTEGAPGADDSLKGDEAPVDDKGTVTPKGDEAAPVDDSQKVEGAALEDELLGIQTAEPETVETLRTKYQETQQQFEATQAERTAERQALKDLGVELVRKDDGTIGLAATEEYASKFNPASLKMDFTGLFDSLSEDEQNLFATDEKAAAAMIANKVAGRVAAQVAAQKPPVNATHDDAVLPPEKQNETANSFINAKMSDGKTVRYPDADGEVMKKMSTVFRSPGKEAADFRRFANRSQNHLFFAMDMLYGKVFRATAGSKAILQDRIAASKAEAIKQGKEPKTAASGASSARTASGGGALSEAELIGRAAP